MSERYLPSQTVAVRRPHLRDLTHPALRWAARRLVCRQRVRNTLGIRGLPVLRTHVVWASIADYITATPGLETGLVLFLTGALLITMDPVLLSAWRGSMWCDIFLPMAPWFTLSGGWLGVLPVLVLILAAGGRVRWKLAGAAALAAGVASLACEMVKFIVGRARPDAWDATSAFVPFSPERPYHSFPSGHATNAAVLALFLAIAVPRLRWLALGWAVGVAMARVSLNRHFPGDVVAGLGIGILVSAVLLGTFRLPLVLPQTGPKRAPTALRKPSQAAHTQHMPPAPAPE